MVVLHCHTMQELLVGDKKKNIEIPVGVQSYLDLDSTPSFSASNGIPTSSSSKVNLNESSDIDQSFQAFLIHTHIVQVSRSSIPSCGCVAFPILYVRDPLLARDKKRYPCCVAIYSTALARTIALPVSTSNITDEMDIGYLRSDDCTSTVLCFCKGEIESKTHHNLTQECIQSNQIGSVKYVAGWPQYLLIGNTMGPKHCWKCRPAGQAKW